MVTHSLGRKSLVCQECRRSKGPKEGYKYIRLEAGPLNAKVELFFTRLPVQVARISVDFGPRAELRIQDGKVWVSAVETARHA